MVILGDNRQYFDSILYFIIIFIHARTIYYYSSILYYISLRLKNRRLIFGANRQNRYRYLKRMLNLYYCI